MPWLSNQALLEIANVWSIDGEYKLGEGWTIAYFEYHKLERGWAEFLWTVVP